MGRRHAKRLDCPGGRGFSVTELLAVVGIIAIMAAVSLPAVARFLRNYKITGAAQQVATEIQGARLNAIMRNVNLGVIFVILNATDYQVATEDDLNPQSTLPAWNWTSHLANDETWTKLFTLNPGDPPQFSPVRSLPFGVAFSATCSNQTASPPVLNQNPNAIGFRFNRIGYWCRFGATNPNCPAVDGQPATTNFVFSDTTGTGSTICLVDNRTGLTRWVSITSGGRIRTGS